MKEKHFKYFRLANSFGLGIDVSRDDYWEYRWWECELHLTLGVYYLTWYIKKNDEEF
jgi:hypothetical protein